MYGLRIKKIKKKELHGDTARIEGKTIYISEDTPKSAVLHEVGHYKLGHNTIRNPIHPKKYAFEEVEADIFAYKQTGNPKHILMKLRAIYNDLTWREYHINRDEALRCIKRAIYSQKTPELWKTDYKMLVKEARDWR